MVKLLDLSQSPWDLRWNALKEILKKQNLELVTESVPSNLENLKSNYEKAVEEDYDILILDESLCDEIFKHVHFKTQETIHLGASNIFVKKDKKLWPTLFFEEALVQAVTTSFHELDLSAPALVAGAGAYSRFVVAALSKIGFKEISITDIDYQKCKKLCADLGNKFFNVKFKPYEFTAVNTLPGESSILINTTPLSLENKLLDELYFFNFLKSHGCVVDLTFVPPVTPLLSEAQTWGARLLSGDRIFALSDIFMFESLMKIKVPEEEYCRALSAQAASVNVDLAPYLKRFMDRI